MSEKNRALYVCRHCQTMVYVEIASATKPPCPRCLHKEYESVSVPVYAQAAQVVRYMLGARAG
ncbi:hypothetical protein SAMN05661010_02747 [Modicisalibacter muralis]|uniref:Zinc-ribbon containing domain-containing protein n=1 Tax=Modicisalibacter muralis TaxID=119000 RepID=A0A1G9NJV2_9GAMM|nr:hypothetical protein SAMN05661010_02747 [Halomonas muralis]